MPPIHTRPLLRQMMLGGAACAVLLLLALMLSGLLAGLGDETGAAAARLMAISTAVALGVTQILLVNLLALRSLAVKIEPDAPV